MPGGAGIAFGMAKISISAPKARSSMASSRSATDTRSRAGSVAMSFRISASVRRSGSVGASGATSSSIGGSSIDKGVTHRQGPPPPTRAPPGAVLLILQKPFPHFFHGVVGGSGGYGHEG